MSLRLYRKPGAVALEGNRLPISLRLALAQRFCSYDGSLHGEEIRLDQGCVSWLNGLAGAGTEGAGELIEAIGMHGAVLIWIG